MTAHLATPALAAWLDAAQWPALAAAARRLGFTVIAADVAHLTDGDQVLQRLGHALALPDWYGANFDALADCLSDPDWLPAAGHLLLIGGLAALRDHDPTSFATLADVLQAVAQARAADGLPFWILIDTPAAGLPDFIAA